MKEITNILLKWNMGSETSESKQDNFKVPWQISHVLIMTDWAPQMPLEEETSYEFMNEFTCQTQVVTIQIIPVFVPFPWHQESKFRYRKMTFLCLISPIYWQDKGKTQNPTKIIRIMYYIIEEWRFYYVTDIEGATQGSDLPSLVSGLCLPMKEATETNCSVWSGQPESDSYFFSLGRQRKFKQFQKIKGQCVPLQYNFSPGKKCTFTSTSPYHFM